MSSHLVERALWAVTCGAALVLVLRLRSSRVAEVSLRASADSVGAPIQAPSSDALLEAIATIRDGNVFRIERHSLDSTVLVEPTRAARQDRPVLTLRGLVGPPWAVIIEGIPGHSSATLLRLGDTVAGFGFVAVRRDSAIIEGADTLYVLRPPARP